MPILLAGGWYDSYTRATFQNFVGLGAGGRRPVRAVMSTRGVSAIGNTPYEVATCPWAIKIAAASPDAQPVNQ
jgi:hypothetical protein